MIDGISKEEELIHALFSNYEKAARPVLNSQEVVNVTLEMTLYQIIDIVSSHSAKTTN